MKAMLDDPIVQEVRAAREAHSRRFGHDLDAIFRDLKEQEKRGGRTLIRLPPRKVEAVRPSPRQST